MAQFDSLIVFPLIWSLLLILVFYYTISIEMLIPDFFGAKSLEKKSLSPSFQHFLRKIQKFKETLLTELFSK
jgi:hypothetical protein